VFLTANGNNCLGSYMIRFCLDSNKTPGKLELSVESFYKIIGKPLFTFFVYFTHQALSIS